MSAAIPSADAPLEVANDWDELLTPEEPSAEERPGREDARPDPEARTQETRQEPGTPATPVAEPPQAEGLEARLARIEAENAEYQRQIANREWSDRGRLLKAQKELELVQARLKEIETARASEDDILRERYDRAIAHQVQSGNEAGADRLRADLRAELAERKAERLEQAQRWERQQREELEQAQRLHDQTARGRQVQAAFAPALEADARALAQELGMDADETDYLVRLAAPPSLRKLAANAPPEVLGQLAIDHWQTVHETAQGMVQRRVARNQQTFDTTREQGGAGTGRDLHKEFDDLDPDDWEGFVALADEGYQPPQQRRRGRR